MNPNCLFFECSVDNAVPMSKHIGPDEADRLTTYLAARLDASRSGLSLTYYLNDHLRSFTVDDALIDPSIPVDGLPDDRRDHTDYLDAEAHWAIAFKLGRLLATLAVRAWETQLNRSRESMAIEFEFNDDGPRETFYTFRLTIVADTAARDTLQLYIKSDE